MANHTVEKKRTMNAFKKMMAWLMQNMNNKGDKAAMEKIPQSESYFQQARSWADDIYTSVITSRNRWRALCLYVLLPITFLFLVMISFLIPIQHIQPFLVHHYENGLVTVESTGISHRPKNRAEIESDIVRYVVNRESYSAASYPEQYSLVNLLSENSVSDEYVKAQSSQNKESPINTLGKKDIVMCKFQALFFWIMSQKRKVIITI